MTVVVNYCTGTLYISDTVPNERTGTLNLNLVPRSDFLGKRSITVGCDLRDWLAPSDKTLKLHL